MHVSPNVSVARFLTLFLQVDAVICAELPPAAADTDIPEVNEQRKKLQDLVLTNMTHDPCGALYPGQACMEEGKCSKKYPKPYAKHTLMDPASGFSTYRRRAPEDGGRTVTIVRNRVVFNVTNADIVPYSPFLCMKFEAHINVEKSNSVQNIKYLHKYCHKGPDQVTFFPKL